MAHEKALLEVRNISVQFGQVKIIHDESLAVGSSQIVALLGPNGAGKTTTVKTIVGLVKPKSGTILHKGTEITRDKPHEIVKRGVAIVPEGRGVFPRLTVMENLKTGLKFIKEDPSLLEEGLEFAFQHFPILKERQGQPAGTLSGGEQTMLVLARAVMSKPNIILMDEPSLGLAPNLIDQCFRIISLFREWGISILLIEQNASRAIEISDHAYILQKGRIVLEGSRAELMANKKIQEAYFS